MADRAIDDALLPLAMALHASPGGYAILAGAGVSVGVGLPSAWGVLTALADQVRVIEDEDAPPLADDTVDSWWRVRFGEQVSYSGVFARLGTTKVEREALLRTQIETGIGPGDAHRAVARLVQLGVISVIVTLNFDRLFETALRELDIEPRVISTAAAAASARPLHDGGAVVVHLHGDYLDADSMLNTEQELASYDKPMQRLITGIVADHGLLIAGWSADHDTALRDIVTREHRGFYRAAWIAPHAPSDTGRDVISALDAHHFATTADDLFGRLADAVTTLRRRHAAHHPLTADVVVDRIKSDLTGGHPAITAHDTVVGELARIETTEILDPRTTPPSDTTNYPTHIQQIAAACTVPAAAIATVAYWGPDEHDAWWLPALERWSRRRTSGTTLTAYLDLPLAVAVRLYYAAGVAAAAARRWRTLAVLVTSPVFINQHRPTELAVRRLDWWSSHDGAASAVLRTTRSDLAETIAIGLGIGTDRVDRAWQEWECLRIIAEIYTSPGLTAEMLDTYLDAQNTFNGFPNEASPGRAAAYENLSRVTAAFGRLPNRSGHHIEVYERWHGAGERDEWFSPAAQRLVDERSDITAWLRMLPTHVTGGREGEAAHAAILGLAESVHLAALDTVDRSGTHGWLNDRRSGPR